jgi:hypothetical protein
LKGHLNCLIFAREKNCPWDNLTAKLAVENGHLDCFQYAVENGCPWEKEKCLKIAKKKKRTLIVSFIENFKEKTIKDQSADNLKISTTCEICLTNKKCVAYEPCGHFSSCHSCADQMKNCPHCRQKIFNLFEIFFL